jgi:uncharacterized glyoxalase superfamily protein PhnB
MPISANRTGAKLSQVTPTLIRSEYRNQQQKQFRPSHKLREDGVTVIHSEITIGGSTIMFTDASDRWPEQTANLFVYVDNADTTYKKAKDAGATTVVELSDQDYGRTCGVTDPLGNVWWITAVKQAMK